MIPQSYEEWLHCITVECSLQLTRPYIDQRLEVWRNDRLEETERFRRLYGDAHLKRVIGWFEQAGTQVPG